MLRRPRLLRLAILLALAACREVAAPGSPLSVQADAVSGSSIGIHILRQSPAAPRLETYRIAFWARRGTQTTRAAQELRVARQAPLPASLRFGRCDLAPSAPAC